MELKGKPRVEQIVKFAENGDGAVCSLVFYDWSSASFAYGQIGIPERDLRIGASSAQFNEVRP